MKNQQQKEIIIGVAVALFLIFAVWGLGQDAKVREEKYRTDPDSYCEERGNTTLKNMKSRCVKYFFGGL